MPQFHKHVRKHDQPREDNKWVERKEINTMRWKKKKIQDKPTNCYTLCNHLGLTMDGIYVVFDLYCHPLDT